MGLSGRMNPDVRVARPNDITGIVALFDEVRDWANAHGYEQTIDPIDEDELSAKVTSGNIYVCDDGEQTFAGSFTLTPFVEDSITKWRKTVSLVPDTRFDLPNTLHLNHLAVARRRAGEGLGICILDRACEITRDLGKSKLFLGCWAGNVKLRRYYTEAGFYLAAIARKIDEPNNCSAIFLRDC